MARMGADYYMSLLVERSVRNEEFRVPMARFFAAGKAPTAQNDTTNRRERRLANSVICSSIRLICVLNPIYAN